MSITHKCEIFESKMIGSRHTVMIFGTKDTVEAEIAEHPTVLKIATVAFSSEQEMAKFLHYNVQKYEVTDLINADIYNNRRKAKEMC